MIDTCSSSPSTRARRSSGGRSSSCSTPPATVMVAFRHRAATPTNIRIHRDLFASGAP